MTAAHFDAAGYVSDMRAAGYSIELSRGTSSWFLGHGSQSGFGLDFMELMCKWSSAFDVVPDAVEQVTAFLMAEQVAA